jgi:hypothetical protein
MLWFSIWFLVILKLPIAYLAYVIWWAVKDPPAPSTGFTPAGIERGDGGGGGLLGSDRRRLPHRPLPGRRPGPHGAPIRRPVRVHARERVAGR